MKMQHALLATLALPALTTSTTAGVIVVNAAGGRDFTAIQPAIDAAVDGDTILVKTGSYAGFTIDGKGVNVVEDSGSIVQVLDTVFVKNLPVAKRVVLNGLAVTPPLTSDVSTGVGLRAQNNAGAIRLHRCDIDGGIGPDGADNCSFTLHATPGKVALQAEASPDIAFTECAVHGGKGGNHGCEVLENPGSGGHAILCSTSNVVAYMCSIAGGHAGSGGDRPANGGDGIRLGTGSGVFSAGSMVHGGNGSNPTFDPRGCWPAGNGGPGLQWLGTTTFLWRLAGGLDGGMGGFTAGCTNQGSHGAPTIGSGSPFMFAVSPLALQMQSVAREGQTVQITFVGDPGDRVALFQGDDTAYLGIPSWRGFLLVDVPPGPQRSIKFCTIPASGTLTRSFHIASLPNGVESKVRYFQAYRTAASGITLGSFVPMVVLDSEL